MPPPRDWNQTDQDTQALCHVFAATTAAQLMLQNNPDRVALVLSGDATNSYVIGTGANCATQGGLRVIVATGPVILRAADLGVFVTGEIWVVATGATNVLSVEIVRAGRRQ